MAQKLLSYRQPKVSRRKLIVALQEQLGAPIRYDANDLGSGELDQSVAFELENTSVGDVIRHVASTANWQVIVESTGIRLTKFNSAPNP